MNVSLFIILLVCVHYIFVEMIIQFVLHVVKGDYGICVYIFHYCHICCFCTVCVTGIYVWCWML
jgi:hypothetical protein